jgi:hypothetical protein
MENGNQSAVTKEYSNLIDKLPGVIKSNIVFSDDAITEIHVLSDTRRSPKQIVRDIQSAIMVQFDVNIDHKMVSIAQIQGQNDLKLRNRLVFDEISITKNKDNSTAAVVLCDGETSFKGEASCLNDTMEVNKMVCRATVDAVKGSIDSDVLLSPADVKVFDLVGKKAVAVCIAVKFKETVEHFVGCSFIGDDTGTAVVKATLDALNRKIAN